MACVFVAATFIGSYLVSALKKSNDEVRKNSYFYYSEKDTKNDTEFEEKVIKVGRNESLKGYKVGCYVSVSDRGNEASDGSGKMGYEWNSQKMMIVGVRENSEFSYACAIVNSNPCVEDVMAWFKTDNLDYLMANKKLISTIPALEKTTIDSNGNETTVYYVPEGYIY